MTSVKCFLCEQITKEYFGENVSKIFTFLAVNGSTSLKEILFRGKFQRSQVVSALQILIKHNFVTYNEGNEVKYKSNLDFVVQRNRLLHFVEIVRRQYGEEAEMILMEFIKHGRMEKNECLKEVLSRVQVDSEAEFKSKLNEVFSSLERDSIITPLTINFSSPSKSVEKMDKGRKRVRTISSDEEEVKTQWVMDMQKLSELMRHQKILQAVRLSQGDECAMIMDVILHTSISPTSHILNSTPPISFNELINTLRKKSKISPEILQQCLDILTKHEGSFLMKSDDSGGGMYKIDFLKSFKELCVRQVQCCIEEIYGSKAKNIFNVILRSVMIEENEIEKKSRDPESVRTLLAKLRKDLFISTMSFPKTSDYNSLSTIYLYKVDLERVARLILEWCYKTASNLIIRRVHEVEANRRLLEIQGKLEVVLSQMEDDEQKAELQKTYISSSEQETLMKLRKNIDMLDCSEVQLDETSFVMETYLRMLGTCN